VFDTTEFIIIAAHFSISVKQPYHCELAGNFFSVYNIYFALLSCIY